MEKIGLMPAAGLATRIGPLPCSKEIYPLGFQYSKNRKGAYPVVACHHLLGNMAKADADKCYVILRPEKWDIPTYLGDGRNIGIHLAYLVTKQTPGAPFTIDQAFPFVENALILFGFPDIIFGPEDAFLRLVDRQRTSKADIVLGLYRAHRPQKMDMVDLDSDGRLREIIIKPSSTDLELTWIIAVWTGVFTRFMHDFLPKASAVKNVETGELYIGDVIREGMRAGLSVETVVFPDGDYVDIGTPEDLTRAVQENIRTWEEVSL